MELLTRKVGLVHSALLMTNVIIDSSKERQIFRHIKAGFKVGFHDQLKDGIYHHDKPEGGTHNEFWGDGYYDGWHRSLFKLRKIRRGLWSSGGC